MNDLNKKIFIALFKEACEKCFGFPLAAPLSETDSKFLSNEIFDRTGLVIGAKSIKNYSVFALNIKRSVPGNPSDATLDTLARYVLNAPFTSEMKRKENESHYPFWFQYRSSFTGSLSGRRENPVNVKKRVIIFLFTIFLASVIFIVMSMLRRNSEDVFTDNFNAVQEDSLAEKGWMVKSIDTASWNRRYEKPGHLTLFTLIGDNWKNDANPAGIKNLLMRRVPTDCFIAEIHLTGFIPGHNWQQAGILLTEDQSFGGKALRFSILYNDFFGGYKKPAEILIQVISSAESGGISKPEEIAHIPLFSIEPGNEEIVRNNLALSVLKIEKKEDLFRFLYTTGPGESFAFKEAVSGRFNIRPRYISLFAIQGWADQIFSEPVYFDSISVVSIPCDTQ